MATYTIANIAKRSGVSVDTVRSYENLGLLPHALRAANYRAYDQDIVPRVRLIRALFGNGFKVEEITQLLSLEEDGSTDSETVRRTAASMLAIVEQKAQLLEQLHKILSELSVYRLARSTSRSVAERLLESGAI